MSTKAKQGVSSAVSSVQKHTSKKDIIEKAVFKATQSTKEEPPKDKHMRTILEDTHILGSGSFTFQEIFKRPVAEKELILFKTIYIVHKMMRDGAPKCCKDIQAHESFLKSMHSQYKGVHTQYGAINAAYLGFLVQKIEFHRKYPEVTGDVDPYKYKERGQKKNTPKEAFDLCVSILDLQKMVLAVEQKILQTGSLNPCKVCPIVPLLYESFNLYNFAVSLLNSLVVYEESDPLIDLFNKQFPVIQKFYFQCTTIPYITAIVARIPELSSVPLFELKGQEKKKMDAPEPKPKKPKKPKKEPVPVQVEFPQPPPMFTNINPFTTSAPNPFQIDPMQLERERLAREVAERAAREAAERAAWEAAERDRLAREAAERAQRAAWEAAERERLAREAAERERLAQLERERLAREAAERAAREAAERAAREEAARQAAIRAERERIEKENRDALKRRIAELEAACRDVERKITDMNGQNDELKRMLNSADGDIQEVQLLMDNRLKQQKEQFLRANGALKAELDQLVAQNQADKAKLLADTKQQAVLITHTQYQDVGPGQLHTELEESAAQELHLAAKTIEGISSQLSNVQPSGPASQRQAAQSILDASQAITLATKLLVGAATEQQTERLKQLNLGLAKPRDPMWTEGLLQAAKALSDAVRALAEAAVLAAQGKIDDAALTGAARAVAAATAQLIMASKEGSGEDSEALQRAADAITRATRGLVEAARMVGVAEEMAEIERNNAEASKSVQEEIEQAANILRIQGQIDRTKKRLEDLKNSGGNNQEPVEKKAYVQNLVSEDKLAAREAAAAAINNRPTSSFKASSPRDHYQPTPVHHAPAAPAHHYPPPTSHTQDFGTDDNPFAPTFLPPPPSNTDYNPFLS